MKRSRRKNLELTRELSCGQFLLIFQGLGLVAQLALQMLKR